MRISTTLQQATDAPYASDIPFRTYEVVNHARGEALKCQFSMNATLQRSKVTVVERTRVPLNEKSLI
jgi:hypothetical protein